MTRVSLDGRVNFVATAKIDGRCKSNGPRRPFAVDRRHELKNSRPRNIRAHLSLHPSINKTSPPRGKPRRVYFTADRSILLQQFYIFRMKSFARERKNSFDRRDRRPRRGEEDLDDGRRPSRDRFQNYSWKRQFSLLTNSRFARLIFLWPNNANTVPKGRKLGFAPSIEKRIRESRVRMIIRVYRSLKRLDSVRTNRDKLNNDTLVPTERLLRRGSI